MMSKMFDRAAARYDKMDSKRQEKVLARAEHRFLKAKAKLEKMSEAKIARRQRLAIKFLANKDLLSLGESDSEAQALSKDEKDMFQDIAELPAPTQVSTEGAAQFSGSDNTLAYTTPERPIKLLTKTEIMERIDSNLELIKNERKYRGSSYGNYHGYNNTGNHSRGQIIGGAIFVSIAIGVIIASIVMLVIGFNPIFGGIMLTLGVVFILVATFTLFLAQERSNQLVLLPQLV